MKPCVSLYEEDLMHESARCGVLNLVPKGQKDTRFLKNLRPITLLNCDYKILEKMVANRMVPSLEEVIADNQTGFLPGRRISTNTRKLLDLIHSSNENQESNLIISCDYMKCFDCIEFECIMESMRLFGFSMRLIRWVRIMYSGFSLKVQNSGFFSAKIKVSCGVHQGGPASNAIFLVVAELIACMLREDTHIKSAWIHEVKQLLNQFADDMDVSIKEDQESMDRVFQHLEAFRKSTGFTLSYDKTTIMRIGSLKEADAKLYTPNHIQWTNDSINVLGLEIVNGDTEQLLAQNYKPLMQKAKGILDSWAHRNLSLIGKINVINTLVGSLYVYKMSTLPRIPANMIAELNILFTKYLWNGHKPKVPLNVLQMSKKDGGLQLVDVGRKDDSLKIAWVRSIFEGKYPSEIPHQFLHPGIGSNIWICNLHQSDVDKVCDTQNVFWKDVLRAWCKFHYQENSGRDELLWLNSNIRVSNAPIWWKKPASRGLMYISDLKCDGKFISEQVAYEKYGLSVMQLNMLKASIRPSNMTEGVPYNDPKFAAIMHTDKVVRYAYKQLSGQDTSIKKLEEKWTSELLEEVSLPQEILMSMKSTMVPKLKSFQYRLMMKAIITNVHLLRWGISETANCTFCNSAKETVDHLLYSCHEIQSTMRTAKTMCEGIVGREVVMSYRNYMFNSVSNNRECASNMVMLILKQYLYRKRCKKELPCPEELKAEIFWCKNIEKYDAIKSGKFVKYICKWKENRLSVEQCEMVNNMSGADLE